MTPRVRLFAGPNGSGKSTIKPAVPSEILGVYLNPDEIEAQIQNTQSLDLNDFGVTCVQTDIERFFRNSLLLQSHYSTDDLAAICLDADKIRFGDLSSSSYLASAVSDFLRESLLKAKVSFSFESVMSHPGKVDFLREAQRSGFRTYLYYVATEDVEINISRVQNRVALGGHDVPVDKIRSRYVKSLDLLFSAIKSSNRAFIFDNSGAPGEYFLIAQITDGKDMEIMCDAVPQWFKSSVLDKIPSPL